MRIKIESGDVLVEPRIDNKTGEAYQSRKQRASVENGTTYPLEFLIPLSRGMAPYAVGEYDVEAPFSSDRYGRLSVQQYMTLRAVAASPRKVA